MPPPLGLGFVITAIVEADHAGCEVRRRIRTCFLVYVNKAFVYWMSKK